MCHEPFLETGSFHDSLGQSQHMRANRPVIEQAFEIHTCPVPQYAYYQVYVKYSKFKVQEIENTNNWSVIGMYVAKASGTVVDKQSAEG
jgi:hypothetical protein